MNELTSILIDAESPVNDASGAKDTSPLESQRSWEHQAEQNIADRLEKSGLFAPKGDVDKMLNTVVNNLIVTSNLNVDAECRVLLTTPLETFSIGHTIAISRGLLDVLPDEASLAMVLAKELAHIALPPGANLISANSGAGPAAFSMALTTASPRRMPRRFEASRRAGKPATSAITSALSMLFGKSPQSYVVPSGVLYGIAEAGMRFFRLNSRRSIPSSRAASSIMRSMM